jgi:hypothetical protein
VAVGGGSLGVSDVGDLGSEVGVVSCHRLLHARRIQSLAPLARFLS